MGAEYVLECNNSRRSIRMSGPWEFYRDEHGKRKVYGHPRAISEEARRRGIYGLSASCLVFQTCEKFQKDGKAQAELEREDSTLEIKIWPYSKCQVRPRTPSCSPQGENLCRYPPDFTL